VRFASARYSVPNRLIGSTVLIAVAGTKIRVLEPFTGEMAAEHELVAQARRASLMSITARPGGQALARGGFLTGASAAGVANLPRGIADILTLQVAHDQPALLEALARAVELKRRRAGDVRSILAAVGAAPMPRAAGAGAGTDAAVGAAPAAERLQVRRRPGMSTAPPTSPPGSGGSSWPRCATWLPSSSSPRSPSGGTPRSSCAP
jgi:hypothetical protein